MTSQVQLPGPVVPGVMYVRQPGQGTAVAAFWLGVVGSVAGLIPLFGVVAVPIGLLALILGIAGVRDAYRNGTGKGMARAGWLLGLTAVLLGVVGLLITSEAIGVLKFG
jgi:hypothetical protein